MIHPSYRGIVKQKIEHQEAVTVQAEIRQLLLVDAYANHLKRYRWLK
jgi:hypothetical protein